MRGYPLTTCRRRVLSQRASDVLRRDDGNCATSHARGQNCCQLAAVEETNCEGSNAFANNIGLGRAFRADESAAQSGQHARFKIEQSSDRSAIRGSFKARSASMLVGKTASPGMAKRSCRSRSSDVRHR